MQAWPDSKLNGEVGRCQHRIAIRLPQDPNDLLFRELRLAQPASSWKPVSSINRWPENPGVDQHAVRVQRAKLTDELGDGEQLLHLAGPQPVEQRVGQTLPSASAGLRGCAYIDATNPGRFL
jgi:hypothetical protein